MAEMVKLTDGTLSPKSKVMPIITEGVETWEIVKAIGSNIKSDRYKVTGGWIVRTFESNEYGRAEKRAFVSDPNHKWKMYMKESFKPLTEDLKKRRN